MALKSLPYFLVFMLAEFLKGKRLVFLKADLWKDGEVEVGTKVTVQIVSDNTQYPQPNISNFGEQITVKVRGVAPTAYSQFKPLSTEVVIKDVERAVVYGQYRNQLSIIASVAVKDSPQSK